MKIVLNQRVGVELENQNIRKKLIETSKFLEKGKYVADTYGLYMNEK